eukprot:11437785-Karenia_brevis.AAC.1
MAAFNLRYLCSPSEQRIRRATRRDRVRRMVVVRACGRPYALQINGWSSIFCKSRAGGCGT